MRYEERLLKTTLRDPHYLAPLQTPAVALMEGALYDTPEMTEGQLADSLMIAYGFFPAFIKTLAHRFNTSSSSIEKDMCMRIASLYRRSQDRYRREYHALLASNVEKYAACMRGAGDHLRETDDARALRETVEAAIALRIQEMPQVITIDHFLN